MLSQLQVKMRKFNKVDLSSRAVKKKYTYSMISKSKQDLLFDLVIGMKYVPNIEAC